MEMDSNELLGEILRRAEQSVLPTLRKCTGRLIDIFNHDITQKRMKDKLHETFSDKLQEIDRCRNAATVFSKLLFLRKLLRNLEEGIPKSESIAFLNRLSNTGFVGLMTDDTFGFLTDERLDMMQRIDEFFIFLEKGSQSNVQNKREAFDEYITDWKAAMMKSRRYSLRHIEREEKKLRAEYDEADKENKDLISSDEFLNEIISCFEPLREIFVKTRENYSQESLAMYSQATANPTNLTVLSGVMFATMVFPFIGLPLAGLAGIAVGSAVKVALNKQLHDIKRTSVNAKRVIDGKWYENTSDFIISYLKDGKTDKELLNFIERENLEPDLVHFNKQLNPWLDDLNQKVKEIEAKCYKIPKELVLREVERMWRFIRAVVLNNPDLADEHQRMMNDMIKDAANLQSPELQTSYIPWISFGQLPLPGGKKERIVEFKFILSNTTGEGVNEILRELQNIFQNVQHTSETKENGISVIKLNIKIEDNVAGKVGGLISKLSDLQIRGVLIGEFGLGNFRHAMNPAYNRIYSLNGVDRAEGFETTYYSGSLDRGGEPYFCPNGWRRFSIHVGLTGTEFEGKYRDWPVAYHGTQGHVAMAILSSGITASGHGCYLNSGEGAVYVSPSIEYCGNPSYAVVWQVRNKYVQMVLQLRIDRNLVLQKRPGTLPGAFSNNPPLDPNFPDNNELEWVIKWPPGTNITTLNGILVYGIMLRVTDQHPKNLPQNAWWETP